MALTVAGTSILCQCEDSLITSLENSSTFQTMAGAGHADQIYLDEFPRRADETVDQYTPAEFDGLFPCAMIFENEEGGIEFNHTSDGGPYGYSHNIFLSIDIQKERGNGSNQDEHRIFKDQCLNILEDLLEQSGGDGTMAISRATNSRVMWIQPELDDANQRLVMTLNLEYRTEI
jgi:hypothetical protein